MVELIVPACVSWHMWPVAIQTWAWSVTRFAHLPWSVPIRVAVGRSGTRAILHGLISCVVPYRATFRSRGALHVRKYRERVVEGQRFGRSWVIVRCLVVSRTLNLSNRACAYVL